VTQNQRHEDKHDQDQEVPGTVETSQPGNVSSLDVDAEEDLEILLINERAKVDDLTDQLQRERAELINYRRRKEQEQESNRIRAIESALVRILPVADDFHRAIKTLPAEVEGNGWAEGFKLIETNLRRALEAQGVTPMESVGKPFDPTRHEAVMFDEDTTGEHMVVEEFQRGYMINDRVLRPAMVKVGSIATDGPRDEQLFENDR
jgi:molecular chaperone GrpE